MVCQREGCENPLVPPQVKWCSHNCRKRACDDRHRGTCVDCGATRPPRSGWGRPASGWPDERCWSCEAKRRHERGEERIQQIAEMYRQGLSMREIAAALGWGDNSRPPEITEAHRRGLIGYRNRGYGDAA